MTVMRATLRSLAVHLRIELGRRFTGSALGLIWVVLAPLLQLAMFALVFVYIFKARDAGTPGVSYLAFLALGMWPWFALAESIGRGCGALVDDAALITKVRIAPWQLVAARVLVAFGLHFVGFLLVAAVLVVQGTQLHLSAVAGVLAGWAMLLVLGGSLATMAALTQLFVRDLQQLLPQVLTAVLFLSPILYSASMAPQALRAWLAFNPIGTAIDLIRTGLLTGSVEPLAILTCAAVTGPIALLAAAMYWRLRAQLEDWL
jgi:lipopolysaccharide transport system permease protein